MITVIIPVYNASQTIQHALQSINSTKPIEILCVDDGSTDNSIEVIHAFEQEMPRHYTLTLIQQDNQGAASARNNGLRHAQYPYVMFLDSDDQLTDTALQCYFEAIEGYPECSVYIGQMMHYKDGKAIRIATQQLQAGKTTLSEQPELLQSIGPGAKVYRKCDIGLFDEDIIFCEEHTLNTQVMMKAVYVFDTPVYLYTIEAGQSITTNTQQFTKYMSDGMKVRQRVLAIIKASNLSEGSKQRIIQYYSYRMDELIIMYYVKRKLMATPLMQEEKAQLFEYMTQMVTTEYRVSTLMHMLYHFKYYGHMNEELNKWMAVHHIQWSNYEYTKFKLKTKVKDQLKQLR
ncbi:glycosyltransferase family A protein [Macrococcus capreoli]